MLFFDKNAYCDFLKLAQAQQAVALNRVQLLIQRELGLSTHDWKPSPDVIIECLRRMSTSTPETLHVWLRGEYRKLTREYDDHMDRALFDSFRLADDTGGWISAQHGTRVKRKPAVRDFENKHATKMWNIAHTGKTGRYGNYGLDTHGKFWVLQEQSEITRKKNRSYVEWSLRKKDQNDRRETVRLNAEHYFGFAGKGDGFERAVEAQLELEAWLIHEAQCSEHHEWWDNQYAVDQALKETDSHWDWLEREYALNYPAANEGWNDGPVWDPYLNGLDDRAQEGDGGYIFADYQGPENPHYFEMQDPLDDDQATDTEGYIDLVAIRFSSTGRVRNRFARSRRA